MDARRTPSFKPTILLPARGIQALGLLLLLFALVLPWWLVKERTRDQAASLIETAETQSGTLRPEMVLLPAPASTTAGLGTGGARAEAQNAPVSTQAAARARRPPFAVAATEITQGQYRRVMGGLPKASRRTLGAPSQCAQPTQAPHLPVVCVTFLEALAYCNRLSQIEGLEACYLLEGGAAVWLGYNCQGYRLPTGAEWVYAATAGTGSRYAGTDDDSALCRFANLHVPSARAEAPPCNDGHPGIAPVASLYPNRWFLYDMTGNAAEWVWLNEQAVIQEKAAATPERAGYIGGNWQTEPSAATVALSLTPVAAPDGLEEALSTVGLRVFRSLGKREVEQDQPIEQLLLRAEHQLAAWRLTLPEGDNAYETFQRVLQQDADNKGALNGLRQIADRYQDLAQSRAQNNNLSEALALVKRGLEVLPTHPGLRTLQARIEQALKAQGK